MTNEEAPTDATVASTLSDMNAALGALTEQIQRMAAKQDSMSETMATRADMAITSRKLDRLLVATPAAAIPEGDFVLSPPRGEFARAVLKGGR